MAEIRVERAPKRRGWLWLVLIVLLLAVAWYLWATGVIGTKTTTTPSDTTRTGMRTGSAVVIAARADAPSRPARAA